MGTPTGIPNSSPAVMWPRAFSFESLGTGRLYPNGPEFGLSNTSGGFGSTGTGRISGVGLSERSLTGLAGQEIERPFAELRRLTDAFSAERARGSNIFGTALGSQFRSQMQLGSFDALESRGSLGALGASGAIGSNPSNPQASFGALVSPSQLTSLDAVLRDRPASADSILRTGL